MTSRKGLVSLAAVLMMLSVACDDSTSPSLAAEGIDLSGTWTGMLLGEPPVPEGNMALSLAQSPTAVTGTGRIEIAADPQYFHDLELTGGVTESGLFEYAVTAITNQVPPPGTFWCTHTASLQYSEAGGVRRLEGTFEAPAGCTPDEGTISLESPS